MAATMQLQTFKAPTMAEALTQVKATLGTDAVIMHTRTYHTRYCLGLRRREIVEITAARGRDMTPRPRRPATAVTAGAAPQRAAVGAGGLSAYARGGGGLPGGLRTQPALPGRVDPMAVPRNPIEGGRAILDTPGGTSAVMATITHEMASLRSMVKDLVTENRQRHTPQVPEDLFDYYMQLIENHVAAELATEVVKSLQQQLRPEHLAQQHFVREKLAEQLEKLMPTAAPIKKTRTVGPHVVALIGPTGVGKTTTIAKLAANLKLREKHRVGLITLDTYRIAAIDQLRRYAEIIGSPVRVANTAEDLRDAVASMQDFDFLLIDTAGRSPNDVMKLNELRNLLAAAEPDEVHLVLSTTANQECIQLAITRFSEVRVDKILFTKLDEAAHVGVVLNVVRKVNKSLSYVTTGQDVPDDIEECHGRRLAQRILGMAI